MMNPVQAFFKYAEHHKKVHVREYVRHTPSGGTTDVEAYDREIDELDRAEGAEEDAILDRPDVPVREADLEAEQPELAPEDPEQERRDIVAIERGKLTKMSKEEELEAWRKWKAGGEKPEDLSGLMKSLQPLIRHRMGPYLGRVRLIPDAAIEAEFNIRAVEALRRYNPDKAGLATHVYRYLEKAKRFVTERQNVGRIPENRIYKIKAYQKARDALLEETGKTPTLPELAKHLKWSLAEVDRMDSELRSDLMTQGFEADPYSMTPSKSEEVLRLFKYELQGREREVYELLTGIGKVRVTSTGEIGKKLGIPDYQVSRIKESIQRKLRKYVDE